MPNWSKQRKALSDPAILDEVARQIVEQGRIARNRTADRVADSLVEKMAGLGTTSKLVASGGSCDPLTMELIEHMTGPVEDRTSPSAIGPLLLCPPEKVSCRYCKNVYGYSEKFHCSHCGAPEHLATQEPLEVWGNDDGCRTPMVLPGPMTVIPIDRMTV